MIYDDACCSCAGGYHPVTVGQVYNARFRVIRKLGWGHFSTVWLALDEHVNDFVALKIVKSAKHYTDAAEDEIRLLTALKDADVARTKPVVSLIDSFMHTGEHGKHVCMVFEVLSCNLLRLIKQTNYKGLPLNVVRSITRQVLEGLDFLAQVGIIHTDLKPENVLLTLSHDELNALAMQPATVKHVRGFGYTDSGSREVSKKVRQRFNRKQKHVLQAATQAVQERQRRISLTIGPEAMSASALAAQQSAPLLTPQAMPPEPLALSDPRAPLPLLSLEPSAASAARDPTAVSPVSGARKTGQTLGNHRIDITPDIRVKIADLGNACWVDRHFTDDIQTRQYRAPEVILGASYNAKVDVWSLACMVFELCTGDFLFNPHSGEGYSRDEDHMARMIETLGPMPRSVAERGKYAKDFFNKRGELRHINTLQEWRIHALLHEKYHWSLANAVALSFFLQPMLDFDPVVRASARDMLKHPWLRQTNEHGDPPSKAGAAPAGTAGAASATGAPATGASTPAAEVPLAKSADAGAGIPMAVATEAATAEPDVPEPEPARAPSAPAS